MISIAMATYNGAKYIREQLDSILMQSIHDFELVVCDDCSTDETWSIIQEYASKDVRIQTFRNEKNLGYRKNFEGLLKLCKGELVAFCDQDDIWKENHLQVLYDNIGDKAICTANAEIIDGDGIKMGFKLDDYTGLRCFSEDALKKAYVLFYYFNPFPGCNTMFRRSFLEKAYPIKDERIKLHDAYACALACVSGEDIKYVNDITMSYRFHRDSVTFNTKARLRSPFRCMIRKLISAPTARRNYVKDQVYYYKEMLSSGIKFTSEQERFLKQAYQYHSRRNTMYGRFLNFLFDVRHYRLIYMK